MLYELKNIRKAKGFSQAEVAKQFDIPLGTYRNWEQCKFMPRDKDLIKQLADYLGVSMEALFGYDLVSPGALSSDDDSCFKRVPLVAAIAAGTPVDPDNVEDHVPVPIEVMKRHPMAFLLKIDGTSMNRVLPDGCYALVDPQMVDVVDNHAYVVKINGYKATAKRIRKLANGLELVPDSLDPTWKTVVCDASEPEFEEVRIIGEIVWYCIPFDFEI